MVDCKMLSCNSITDCPIVTKLKADQQVTSMSALDLMSTLPRMASMWLHPSKRGCLYHHPITLFRLKMSVAKGVLLNWVGVSTMPMLSFTSNKGRVFSKKSDLGACRAAGRSCKENGLQAASAFGPARQQCCRACHLTKH